MDQKKGRLSKEELKSVNGGVSGVFGGRQETRFECPNCHAHDATFQMEHDEIAVFNCNKCGRNFSVRF